MRFVVVLAVAFVVVYVALVGLLFLAQRLLVFPSYMVDGEMAAIPVDGFEIVQVPTSDGEVLRGFWRAPAPGMPIVVSFHGNADAPRTHAVRFSSSIWSGYGVLAVAFRGYPGSTGSTTEEGLLLDGEAAVAYARSLVPDAPLILQGHSLGSTIAVAMSERHASVALLLEAPILSMRSMVGYRLPVVPGFLVLDQLRSDLRIVGSRACMVLVAHGDRDGTVPNAFGRGLAALSDKAEFRSMPGYGHNDVVGAADEWFVARLREGCDQAA